MFKPQQFPSKEDLVLQKKAIHLLECAGQLDKWIIKNSASRKASPHPLSSGLQFQVLELRRQAHNLIMATSVPVALTIYGASNCGKSLLVGKLIKAKIGFGSALGIPGAEMLDGLSFEEDLNPQKGIEATAVVTRFSPAERLDIPTRLFDHPVRARLFSRADIIKSLARGFFTECTEHSEWKEKAVTELVLQELVKNCSGSAIDPEWRADIVEACRYMTTTMRSHFIKFDHLALNQILADAPLNSQGYEELACKLFWDDRAPLSLVFRQLLELRTKMFANADSIMMQWPVLRFILDSSLVEEHFSEKLGGTLYWSNVRVREQSSNFLLTYGSDGRPVQLTLLQAIISELQIPLVKEKLNEVGRGLFETSDCLDIPGARASAGSAGYSYEDLDHNTDAALRVLKRGKVGLMFDKYAEELQASVVLYLQKHGNLDVKETRPQLLRWGRARFGDGWPVDVPSQELMAPSLFVGLTNLAHLLCLTPDEAALDQWIEGELARNFPDWIDCYGYDKEGFKNTFLIWYPDTMDRDDPNRGRFDIASWNKVFMASRAVKRYIADPESKWKATFDPNDHGVRTLIESIIQKLDNGERRTMLNERINALYYSLRGTMAGVFVDPKKVEERNRREKVVHKILRWLEMDFDGKRTQAILDEMHCDSSLVNSAKRMDQERELNGIPRTINFESISNEILMKWQTTRNWQRVCSACRSENDGIDEQLLNQFAAYLVDYLRSMCLATIARALERANKIENEAVKDTAFLRHGAMIIDDFLVTPGPRLPLNKSLTGIKPHKKLYQRWDSILTDRILAPLGVSSSGEPSGNSQLADILESLDF